MSPTRRITNLDASGFHDLMGKLSCPPFRAQQLYHWVHGKGVSTPDGWTNIPQALKDQVAELFDVRPPSGTWNEDPASATDKLYLDLGDEDGVEAVLIREGDRTTLCLSSQVGCPVACTFCASGTLGLRRNLSKGEILDQYHLARTRAEKEGRRIGNIVMMGMGEPLLNYEAVTGALHVLNDPGGGGIGARHLTVSTVGLSKGVERLRRDGLQYTLAFSLHAPNDELRRELIPFPGAMSIAELIEAARGYLKDKGREVTFEYVLLDEVNESPDHAKELADRLRGVRGTVNLIPYNENPGLGFQRPSPSTVDRFAELLRQRGLKVSVRKRKGNSILAACGQLRLQNLKR